MPKIKRIIFRLFFPLISNWLLWRYKGIFGLKSRIQIEGNLGKRKLFILVCEELLSRSGSWIGYDSQFAGIPCFPHGINGIFISEGAQLGKNVVIFQHVPIGSNTLNDSLRTGSPKIGNNVYIGAGAKIIGGVTIGDNCRIGANAAVYMDMPPNSVAVQHPTRLIQKEALDNRFYAKKSNGEWVYFDDSRWIVDKKKTIMLRNQK